MKYVPQTDAEGTDGFSYRVTDCLGSAVRSSEPFDVEIHIAPVNDRPTIALASQVDAEAYVASAELATASFALFQVEAADVDALDIPRLVISQSASERIGAAGTMYQVLSVAPTLRPGASLQSGDEVTNGGGFVLFVRDSEVANAGPCVGELAFSVTAVDTAGEVSDPSVVNFRLACPAEVADDSSPSWLVPMLCGTLIPVGVLLIVVVSFAWWRQRKLKSELQKEEDAFLLNYEDVRGGR